MPLSQIQSWQPGWIDLSSNMVDIGADGIGGVAAGICRFIAPIKCRIRSVGVSFQAAVSAANGIRVDAAAGVIGDDQDIRSMEAPVNAGTNTGFLCTGFDDRNNLLDAGQMFRVRSDGNSGAAIRSGVTVSLEPVGPIDWSGSLFAFSGFFPIGTVATGTNYPSIPGGYEVLQAWGGLSATIAAQANSILLLKNGTDGCGTISLAAGGADLSTFTDVTTRTSPNRFVRQEDFLQVFLNPGGANFTSQIPYTVLCRRLL